MAIGSATAIAIVWRGSVPELNGEAPLPGLSAAVTVETAENGVPTLRAASMRDAYRALGYLHARDRMFQMEMTRRIGSGRVSELIGERGLGIDRFMRTLGLAEHARETMARLPATIRADFEAYEAGVNAWLQNRETYLPVSFQILWHEPEPWTVADSILWGKLMAFRLSGDYRSERRRARLLERLSPERLEQLLPAHDKGGPITLSPEVRQALRVLPPTPKGLGKLEASNAWVVAAKHGKTDAPILANDPHLDLGLPGVWYPVRIETPELTVTGVTAPGVPLHVLGHNGHIAWGMTTTYADTMDLVAIIEDPKDPTRYLTADGPHSYNSNQEKIVVRGDDEVRTVEVRGTIFGPVLPGPSGSPRTALQWTALDSDERTPVALHALNRARDWDDFLIALKDFGAPIQNLFFASSDGDIGVAVPGMLPLRAEGHTGTLPLASTDARAKWLGISRRSPSHALLNPASGRIHNANNRVVPPLRVPQVAMRFQPPDRALRLYDAMFPTPPSTPKAHADLQTDSLSYAAKRLVPLFLEQLPEGSLTAEARTILGNWDYRMDPSLAAPALYAAWHNSLFTVLVGDDIGPENIGAVPVDPAFLERALSGIGGWCDDKRTDVVEDCGTALSTALEDAFTELFEKLGPDPSAWRWGDLHRAPMGHRILDFVPILGDIASQPVATPGGDHTLNRGQMPGVGAPVPYAHVHGAGLRAVYDLSNFDQSLFAIAGGVSGNPASPYYGNLVAEWAAGRYFRISGRGEDRKSPIARLSLIPAERP